jgi:Ca2+-binding EF-hand superfamily protein
MVALDVNTNGLLEATEIANASTALKSLDKNGDGKLSAEELMPQFPGSTNQARLNPPRGGGHPVSPLMSALDTNSDGELDADEIANAGAALLKLDTNGDGQLTMDELRPKRPDGAGGPGGPDDGPGPGGPERPGSPGEPPGAPPNA